MLLIPCNLTGRLTGWLAGWTGIYNKAELRGDGVAVCAVVSSPIRVTGGRVTTATNMRQDVIFVT